MHGIVFCVVVVDVLVDVLVQSVLYISILHCTKAPPRLMPIKVY